MNLAGKGMSSTLAWSPFSCGKGGKPSPWAFPRHKDEEPDALGSLADCQADVCSLGKVLHLPGLLSGERVEGKPRMLPVVLWRSETHCKPV